MRQRDLLPLEWEFGLPVVATLARWSNPFAWRSGRRNVRRLNDFSRAELNTLVELEAAANLTRSAERAAAYLQHAADEARHARMFHAHARRLARDHDLPLPDKPRTDTAHLFATLGEADFLAFVHRGEGRGRAQFEAHRDHFAAVDPRGEALFNAILEDEARHEAYAIRLLEGFTPNPRGRLRRMALWEAWTLFRRLQRRTAELLFYGSLFLLFPLFWVLAFWTRRVRPRHAGWR